jgi:fructokinase
VSASHPGPAPTVAAIEAGGTKFRVAVGTGPGGIRAERTIPTTSPAETLDRVVEFVRSTGAEVAAAGIASFGPIDLDPASPSYGSILQTPKPGWSGAAVLGVIASGLGVPAAVDTDVGGAALAEMRWGAARGLGDIVYFTVGTGIGAGVAVGGRIHHGIGHPEAGHLPVRREPGDTYPGHCPFHGGCLEGMACGPAIEDRWGRPGSQLGGRDEVWDLEARYLAQGILAATYLLAPQRVVLGGGVMQQPGLLDRIRRHLERQLAGYGSAPLPGGADGYVAAAALGPDAGLLGAVALGIAAAG